MPTDLSKVHNHPAAVIMTAAQPPDADGDMDIPAFVGAITEAEYARRSAQTLRDYEREYQVTFAALDNVTLAEVRDLYARMTGAAPAYPLTTQGATQDFADAVCALLGLAD